MGQNARIGFGFWDLYPVQGSDLSIFTLLSVQNENKMKKNATELIHIDYMVPFMLSASHVMYKFVNK